MITVNAVDLICAAHRCCTVPLQNAGPPLSVVEPPVATNIAKPSPGADSTVTALSAPAGWIRRCACPVETSSETASQDAGNGYPLRPDFRCFASPAAIGH